ncbi:DapH/DapD/GlmU-related protein [Nakamurella flava]|uniref:DapH/DapD/GlmU-related protein n=1 Tax=Nakamurella flava TaxID=2576308 RepID=UPI00197BB700|nr:DapH/DapD/GlmU-related protein [Nakamurella flava]
MGRNSLIDVSGTIGDYFLVAANVAVVGRQDHAIDEIGVPVVLSAWVGNREPTPQDLITIGDDVWIGAGAVVLSGIRVGHAAVIAAGAVVINDVPDFAVVAGCPARVVGARFDDSQGRRHLDVLNSTREYL